MMEEKAPDKMTKLNRLKGQFATILIILSCVNLLLWFIVLAYTVTKFADVNQQLSTISHKHPKQNYVSSHQKQSLTIRDIEGMITSETAAIRNQTYQQEELMVKLSEELKDLREDVEELYSVHQNFNQFWVSLVEKISVKEKSLSTNGPYGNPKLIEPEVEHEYSGEGEGLAFGNGSSSLWNETVSLENYDRNVVSSEEKASVPIVHHSGHEIAVNDSDKDSMTDVNDMMAISEIHSLHKRANYDIVALEQAVSPSEQQSSENAEEHAVEVVSTHLPQKIEGGYTAFVATELESTSDQQYSGDSADIAEGKEELSDRIDEGFRVLKESWTDQGNSSGSKQRYTLPLPEQIIELLACRQGPKGEQGDQGLIGLPGHKGATGLKGSTGLQGPEGMLGPKGDIGEKGYPGVKGDRGEPGIDGMNGAQGILGLKGDMGEPGMPGVKGSQGGMGLAGPRGLKGMAGSPGVQGLTGIPGTKGETGQRGSDGLNGRNGMKGEKGEPGLYGPAGLKGEQGEPGRYGPAGLKGEKGVRGEAGLVGVPGLRGPAGPTGQPGKDGAEVIIPDLFPTDVISSVLNTTLMMMERGGLRGPPGVDGISGTDGVPGTDGIPGQPGTDGTNGISGTNGVDGTPGVDGQPGSNGTDGTPGQDGTASGIALDHWYELVKASDAHFLLNDRLYTFHRTNKTWDSAQSHCQANSATLLTFSDLSLHSQIMHQITVTVSDLPTRIWVGGRRDEYDEFQWINPLDTSQPIQSALWNFLEPNNANGREHCAELRGNKLNDITCSTSQPYICMSLHIRDL